MCCLTPSSRGSDVLSAPRERFSSKAGSRKAEPMETVRFGQRCGFVSASHMLHRLPSRRPRRLDPRVACACAEIRNHARRRTKTLGRRGHELSEACRRRACARGVSEVVGSPCAGSAKRPAEPVGRPDRRGRLRQASPDPVGNHRKSEPTRRASRSTPFGNASGTALNQDSPAICA
jgi:hypothetical protein